MKDGLVLISYNLLVLEEQGEMQRWQDRTLHAEILWVWPNSMYFDCTSLYCTNNTTFDMGPIKADLSGGLLLTEKYE